MATHKVIQDIEAEDKFLGPLTLKQFVFGATGIFFGYLSFFALIRGFPAALIIFAPPTLLGLFLAVPWSKDQPTEVWVLAKLRFRLKPKKRIWDQSGMEELVTITAPKVVEKILTDGLDQTEVRSRLKALAETIDSRGWVVKHAEMGAGGAAIMTSDRLVNPAMMPQEVPTVDLNAIPDVMDSSTSAGLDSMLQQSTDMRLQQNLDKLDRIRHGEPLEAVQQPVNFTPPPIPQNDTLTDEEAISAQLKAKKGPNIATDRMRTIQPANPYAVDEVAVDQNIEDTDQYTQAQASMPSSPTPAILDYASNDDLDIATIARQAQKDTQNDSGEVVISLR